MAKSLLAPGHTACLGCGEALAARLVINAAGPNTIIAEATGCLEIISSRYPESAWEVPWIHSLFDNTAAVAAGIEAALQATGRAGQVNVLSQGGDGATADIGFGPLSGAWERGHDVLHICYDNEAYMNTGVQRSGLTPFHARTSTSPPGKLSLGNPTLKKDMPAIALAHGVPYVATSSAAFPRDIERKVKKALSIRGPKYLQIHVPCPLGWGFDPSQTVEMGKLAVQTGLYPIFEYENGVLTGSMKVKPRPVEDYLKAQVRFRHLFAAKGEALEEQIRAIQQIADANLVKYQMYTPPAEGA